MLLEITFTIPNWLLWTAGILAGIVVLILAAIGVILMWAHSTSMRSTRNWFGW